MMDKNQLETLLRIQGVSPTLPDEEIRSILISAKFSDSEIETAFTVLRQNVVDNTSRSEGLHKVFRSEKGLLPHEISQLLGIDMTISEVEIKKNRKGDNGVGYYVLIVFITFILAFLGISFAMYTAKIGPFHHSALVKVK